MDMTTGELSEAEAVAQAEALAGSAALEEIDIDGQSYLIGVDIGSEQDFSVEISVQPPSEADIIAALLPDSLTIPPAPGSEFSPFRRCACLGTMPGRACLYCSGTRWLKTCTTCSGAGKLLKQARQASQEPRGERCGFCMGRGSVPANVNEVREAQAGHDSAMISVEQGARIRLLEDQPGYVRTRAAKLPKAEGSTTAPPRSSPGKRQAAKRARSSAARAKAAAKRG